MEDYPCSHPEGRPTGGLHSFCQSCSSTWLRVTVKRWGATRALGSLCREVIIPPFTTALFRAPSSCVPLWLLPGYVVWIYHPFQSHPLRGIWSCGFEDCEILLSELGILLEERCGGEGPCVCICWFVGLFFRRVDSGLCQVVGSCLIWGLGTKLKSSSKAAIFAVNLLSYLSISQTEFLKENNSKSKY